MTTRTLFVAGAISTCAALAACKSENAPQWLPDWLITDADAAKYVSLNDPDADCLSIDVRALEAGETPAPSEVPISLTNSEEDGTFSVDPAAGPVGTLFLLRLQLPLSGDVGVDRVLVYTADLFPDTSNLDSYFAMQQDPALDGRYELHLEALGNEPRTNEFCVYIQTFEQ